MPSEGMNYQHPQDLLEIVQNQELHRFFQRTMIFPVGTFPDSRGAIVCQDTVRGMNKARGPFSLCVGHGDECLESSRAQILLSHPYCCVGRGGEPQEEPPAHLLSCHPL